MMRWVWLFSLVFVLFSAPQSQAADWGRCSGDDNPALAIKDCTGYLTNKGLKARDKSTALYSRANAYYKAGKKKESLADYNAAIRTDPTYAYAWAGRGYWNYYDNQMDKAIADYSESIRLDKTFAYPVKSRGDAYYAKQLYAEAASDYSRAIKLTPNDGDAYYGRGSSYSALARYDEAIADYNKTIELKPNYGGAYVARGNVHWNLGDMETALDNYEQAVAAEPNSYYGWAGRGLAKAQLDRIPEAIEDLTVAINLSPEVPRNYAERGSLYEKQGDATRALADFAAASSRYPQGSEDQKRMQNRLAALSDKVGSGNVTAKNDTSSGNSASNNSGGSSEVGTVTSGRRIALVIGNSAYQNAVELPNPRNDAESIAAMLQSLGFDVVTGTDLTKTQMDAKLREFIDRLDGYDVALVFYAGHGISVGGKSYLVPVDARLESESAVQFEMVEAEQLYSFMGNGERVSIVLLDACRDNPFARTLSRSLGVTRSASVVQGLAAPNIAGGGMLIGFATAPGNTASDGEGNNSPFTQALLKHLPEPGLEIEQAMKRIKADVVRATGGKQRPWHNSDLIESVFLR